MELSHSIRPALAAISGGLGDIGIAIAKCLSAAGADIALCDVVEPLGNLDSRYHYARANVADSAEVAEWYAGVEKHFGRSPSIIVPNAAIVTVKSYAELLPEEWSREISVNLNGSYHFAHSGVEGILRTGNVGRVIFVGSWAGHAPHPRLPAYSVAKAGVRMLMKTLALEVAERDILVNEVAPGYVDAGLSGRMFAQDPAMKTREAARVPVRKLLTADDVAWQVGYLCSPGGDHITGTTLLQDGGLSLLQGPTP